jgi:membrane protease YdiL (CAAX protease family)
MIWWIFTKAHSGLNRITTTKGESLKKYLNSHLKENVPVTIKIRNEGYAHFIKDLIITSRNIKVFLSVVTPVIISFVFTYTFNFTVLGGQTPLDTSFIYNWSVILALQPVVCGMLLYNLLNIEGSGTEIINSLPINPKNQAKAKLLYLLIIQTISVIVPYIIYVGQSGFLELLITILLSLPYAWFVLISMFQMHVYLFGRKKRRYVLELIHPGNKFVKWTFIYILEYILYFIIISMGIVLTFRGMEHFLSSLGLVTIIFYSALLFSFKIMFRTFPKLKIRRTITLPPIPRPSNWFRSNPWISITLLFIFNYFLIIVATLSLMIRGEMPQINRFQIIYGIMILSTIFAILVRKNIVPKSVSFPYFQHKSVYFRIFVWTITSIFFTIFYNLFSVNVFSIPYSLSGMGTFQISFYGILASFVFAVWNEILFRGIFFPLFLTKYSRIVALFLTVFLFAIYFFIYNIFLAFTLGSMLTIPDLLYIIVINLYLTYQFSKHANIFPAIIAHFVSTLLGAFPLFYFGMYVIFS